jgi:type II secretory pathway pseudopilin PulG
MKKNLFLISVIALSGCASSVVDYTSPTPPSITKGAIIPNSFEDTWDKLVQKLSEDFFIINNIEKNSRIINVSFTAQHPEKYVTCGTSRRLYIISNEPEEVIYDPASSSNFNIAITRSGVPYSAKVSRRAKLEGRANIYVAPSQNNTKVTVNSKYVLSINITSQLSGGIPLRETHIVDLSTSSPYIGDDMECYSTGKLEKTILDYAL